MDKMDLHVGWAKILAAWRLLDAPAGGVASFLKTENIKSSVITLDNVTHCTHGIRSLASALTLCDPSALEIQPGPNTTRPSNSSYFDW